MAVLARDDERRGATRRPLSEIPRVVAVKVSSELVDVINASANGLLVEGSFPVRPGMTSYVDLIEAAGNTVRVNGTIVRCQIASLGPSKPRYRFAIVFDREVPMMGESIEPAAISADAFGFLIDGTEIQADPSQALNNW
jgi:hypothetical protein